jgi:hypothetical protein
VNAACQGKLSACHFGHACHRFIKSGLSCIISQGNGDKHSEVHSEVYSEVHSEVHTKYPGKSICSRKFSLREIH